jgi:predicted nucleic acid-binding Zn ribbon protein
MIEPHKHCPGCGTPVPMGENYCSPRCQQIIVENQKKVKKTRNLIYILFAVFILIWLFFILRGKVF